MKYYFVISHNGNYYELEALADNRKIVVMKSDNTVINQATHKTATIMKILPQNYRLSRFRDPEEHLLFKEGDNCVLYDLSTSIEEYRGEDIKYNSIIGLTDWEILQ